MKQDRLDGNTIQYGLAMYLNQDTLHMWVLVVLTSFSLNRYSASDSGINDEKHSTTEIEVEFLLEKDVF